MSGLSLFGIYIGHFYIIIFPPHLFVLLDKYIKVEDLIPF